MNPIHFVASHAAPTKKANSDRRGVDKEDHSREKQQSVPVTTNTVFYQCGITNSKHKSTSKAV